MEILDGAIGKLQLRSRSGVVADGTQQTEIHLGILEATNYFRHFYIQNERAIAIAIAIAAELAASQMIGYPACLYNSRLPTSFAIRTPGTLMITYRY